MHEFSLKIVTLNPPPTAPPKVGYWTICVVVPNAVNASWENCHSVRDATISSLERRPPTDDSGLALSSAKADPVTPVTKNPASLLRLFHD